MYPAALKIFLPNKLLLRLVLNTPSTPIDTAGRAVKSQEVSLQSAYVNQPQLDGYSQILTIEKGLSTRKLWPGRRARSSSDCTAVTWTTHSWRYGNWDQPHEDTNFETLEGLSIGGRFRSQRLLRFFPRDEAKTLAWEKKVW
jgi:hypothetical protein